MAAATVTQRIEVRNPNMEVVQLTVTEAETYTSRKFKVVYAATATGNADVDAYLNVVTDGTSVVTIHYAGQTDKLVTLVLYGKLGN